MRSTLFLILAAMGSAAPALADPVLTLNADNACYTTTGPGNAVTVTIDLSGATTNIVGGQFFLEYDRTRLDFVSMDVSNMPWDFELIEIVDEAATPTTGTIDYAVASLFGGGATSGPMAVISFTALSEVCFTADLVTFRSHTPPTTIADENDDVYNQDMGNLQLNDLGQITIDDTAPTVTCPADMLLLCTDSTDPSATGTPTVSDNCGVASTTFADTPHICNETFVRTWTSTDFCGHETSCAQNITIEQPCETPATLMLTVNDPADECVQPGEMLTVSLEMGCSPVRAAGFQAFLEFDPAVLTFVSGSYTATPFGLPVIDPIVADGPNIDLASGINQFTGQNTTVNAAVLVNLEFMALSEDCTTALRFRSHNPPARLSDILGNAILPLVLVDSPNITVDGTPPMITCPADVSVNSDAGLCSAVESPGMATAVDNCDGAPAIVGVRSDGMQLTDPYPSGTTTITWTATDACDNSASCMQTIDVSGFNEIAVTVQLSPTVATPLTRCITFEVFLCGGGPPVVVEDEMTFVNGVATGVVLAPCAVYDCITARDRLHTLRRTDLDDFGIVGSQYVADFTNQSGMGGDDDSLVGGNLNDDDFIDILDFGLFAGQFNVNYGTGDTTCATASPHADISGDGLVFTADYTFIQINFLREREANCCGLPDRAAPDQHPIMTISVDELNRRGLADLAAGDLNGDGLLDQFDIVAFAMGARPAPPAGGQGETGPRPPMDAAPRPESTQPLRRRN